MNANHDAGRPAESVAVKKAGAEKKNIKNIAIVSIAAVALVGILAIAAFSVVTKSGHTNVNANASIMKDDYQAVFLTNGQVYFGKLQNAQGDYLKLTNIYYLQVDSNVQQAGGANATAQKAATDSSNVQLIKLGNELHGPRDEMQLNKEQVLFWENLKGDSKVSEAIKNYKN